MRDRKLSDQTLPRKGSRNPSFTFKAILLPGHTKVKKMHTLSSLLKKFHLIGKWIVLNSTALQLIPAYTSQSSGILRSFAPVGLSEFQ